jgi:hypothetical protein
MHFALEDSCPFGQLGVAFGIEDSANIEPGDRQFLEQDNLAHSSSLECHLIVALGRMDVAEREGRFGNKTDHLSSRLTPDLIRKIAIEVQNRRLTDSFVS